MHDVAQDSQGRKWKAGAVALCSLWFLGIGRFWWLIFQQLSKQTSQFNRALIWGPLVVVCLVFAASFRSSTRSRSLLLSYVSSALLIGVSVLAWGPDEAGVYLESLWGPAAAAALSVVGQAALPIEGRCGAGPKPVLSVIALGVLLLVYSGKLGLWFPDRPGITEGLVVAVLCVCWVAWARTPAAGIGALTAVTITAVLASSMTDAVAIRCFDFEPRASAIRRGFEDISMGMLWRGPAIGAVSVVAYSTLPRGRGARWQAEPEMGAICLLLLAAAAFVLRIGVYWRALP